MLCHRAPESPVRGNTLLLFFVLRFGSLLGFDRRTAIHGCTHRGAHDRGAHGRTDRSAHYRCTGHRRAKRRATSEPLGIGVSGNQHAERKHQRCDDKSFFHPLLTSQNTLIRNQGDEWHISWYQINGDLSSDCSCDRSGLRFSVQGRRDGSAVPPHQRPSPVKTVEGTRQQGFHGP